MTTRRTPRPVLRVLRGPTLGQIFEIDRVTSILGRDPSCEIVIDSQSISRRHARIERRPQGVFLEDLGSTGGTRINNQPVHGVVPLCHGDRIEVADCLMVYTSVDSGEVGGGRGDTTILGIRDTSGTAERALVGVRPAEKLSAILEISRDLVGSLAWEEVLGKVLDGLFRIFPQADRGFVLLGEAGKIELVPTAMKLRYPGPARLTLSRSVLEHVMIDCQAVLSEDIRGDLRFEASRSVDEAGVRTLMCVPLRDHTRRPVGAIQIDTSDPDARFGPEDLDLLVAVASQVSMAVDNARLYREAQVALRRTAESQALVDAILSAAPVAVAFLDTELRFLRVNQAMAAINGLAVNSHLGRKLGDILPVVALRLAPLIQTVAATGKPILGMEIKEENPAVPERAKSWLGYCYPAFGPDGRTVGIGLILEDVTEARRSEAELRASEERYRILFESNPHSMWVYDTESLRFLAVNEAAIRNYGYSREEFLSMTILDIRPEEDHALVHQAVQNVRGTTYLNASGWRHRKKDGSIVSVEISSHALQFAGRPARLVLSSDVTRRLEAEAAVLAAKESAEAANRAKDRFLAVLSHELRTPLTPVLLSVSALLDRGEAPEDLRPTLEMIRRNVQLEARLVDDLLDIARITRGGLAQSPEVLDIHQAIREAVDICQPAVQAARLDVVYDLTASEPYAKVDPARIKQVFWNLIRNAAKFTPPGGRLTIRSRNEDGAFANALGTRIVLEFADTGIGIEPDLLPRIFAPFEQGETGKGGRHGGLGLGLAISLAIAEAHGGRLTATSPGRDQGSTFRLELTSVPAPSDQTSVPDDFGAASTPAGTRVLLVEDNRDTLRYLRLVLEQRGFQVVAAENIESARAAASQQAFDLLISDIELPDGTGIELMREIGSAHALPGIAMSGFGSEDDIQMSMEAGFREHLTKPVDTARLDAAVGRAMRQRPSIPTGA
ncbi:MAG: domain S-box [Planctomycetota bacterium]|nr:domain S-box [Planctomycetota bacterium]